MIKKTATLMAGEEIQVGELTYIGSDGKIHCRPSEPPIAQILLFALSDTEFTSMPTADRPVAYVNKLSTCEMTDGRVYDLTFHAHIGEVTESSFNVVTGEHRLKVRPTHGKTVLPKNIFGGDTSESFIGRLDYSGAAFDDSNFAWDSSPMHPSPEGIAVMSEALNSIKAMPPIADLNLTDEQIRLIQTEMSKSDVFQLGSPTAETSIEVRQDSELFPLVQWLAERFLTYERAGVAFPNSPDIAAHLEQIMPLPEQPVYGESPIGKIWDVWTSSQQLQQSARDYFANGSEAYFQQLREEMGFSLPSADSPPSTDPDEPIVR